MMYDHVDANELRHVHVLTWVCYMLNLLEEIVGEHSTIPIPLCISR